MPQLLKFFFALAILIAIGCTVEKRLHNRGYHLEWRHSFSKKGSTSEIEICDLNDTTIVVGKQEGFLEDKEGQNVLVNKRVPVSDKAIQVKDLEDVKNEDEPDPDKPKAKKYVRDNRPEEPIGIISALVLALAYVLEFAPYSTINPIVSISVLCIAFGLSILSIMRYRSNTNVFKHNNLGLVTFVLCIGTLILATFIFFVVMGI